MVFAVSLGVILTVAAVSCEPTAQADISKEGGPNAQAQYLLSYGLNPYTYTTSAQTPATATTVDSEGRIVTAALPYATNAAAYSTNQLTYQQQLALLQYQLAQQQQLIQQQAYLQGNMLSTNAPAVYTSLAANPAAYWPYNQHRAATAAYLPATAGLTTAANPIDVLQQQQRGKRSADADPKADPYHLYYGYPSVSTYSGLGSTYGYYRRPSAYSYGYSYPLNTLPYAYSGNYAYSGIRPFVKF